MPKYENPAFAMDDDADEFLEGAQEQGSQEEPKGDKGAADWERRYGDLRRHQAQKDQQHQQEIAELKAQVEQATKQQIKFPKTAEEVEAWKKKYPEVAGVVETIAQMTAAERFEEANNRFAELDQRQKAQTAREAMQELLNLHPDFMEIRAEQEFHDWIAEQPAYVSDALYKNDTDARAAARAIDLYKADKGITKAKPKARDDRSSAARGVGAGGRAAPEGKTPVKWTESKVAAMSVDDYDKHEDEILEAMRKGQFDYDLSGGAR